MIRTRRTDEVLKNIKESYHEWEEFNKNAPVWMCKSEDVTIISTRMRSLRTEIMSSGRARRPKMPKSDKLLRRLIGRRGMNDLVMNGSSSTRSQCGCASLRM